MSAIPLVPSDPSNFNMCSKRLSSTAIAFLVLYLLYIAPLPLYAAPTATTTTLVVAASPISLGTGTRLSASVTAGGAVVTAGQVTFCFSGAKYCEGNAILGVAQLKSDGTAELLRYFPESDIELYAVYSGTATYAPSKSSIQLAKTIGTIPSTTTLETTKSSAGYAITATVKGSERNPLQGSVEFNAIAGGNQSIGSVVQGTSVRTHSLIPQFTYSIPAGAIMRAADIGGDGFPDLISVAPKPGGGGTLTAYLTENPYFFGVFGPAIMVKADLPGRPYDIVVGDFDRDGNSDMAVLLGPDNPADTSPGSIYLLLNRPLQGRVYIPGGTFPAGPNVNSAILGDFNYDGIQDFVIRNDNQTISLLFGDPNNPGSFQPPVTRTLSAIPTGMISSDFNGDGIPDLAFSSSTSGQNRIEVLLNDAAHPGQFLPEISYPLSASAISLTAGDLNQDGLPDLVFAKSSSLGLLFNDPAHPGNFLEEKDYSLPSSARSIALGDYNGDGLLDVALLIDNGTNVGIMRTDEKNPGTLLPLTKYSPGAGPFDTIQPADLNFNDMTDLAVISSANHTIGGVLVQYTQTRKDTATVATLPGGYVQARYTGDGFYASSESCILNVDSTVSSTPVIGPITMPVLTPIFATFNWKTDIPTQGVVDYGIGSLQFSSPWTRVPSTDHSITLSNLSPHTQYTFRVRNIAFSNGCGHWTATSPTKTFTTAIPHNVETTIFMYLYPQRVSAGQPVHMTALVNSILDELPKA